MSAARSLSCRKARQPGSFLLVVNIAERPLRTPLDHGHNQFRFRRVARRVGQWEAHGRASRPPHPSRAHSHPEG